MDIFEIVMTILSVLALSVIGFDAACSIIYNLKSEKKKHAPAKPKNTKVDKVGYTIERKKVEVIVNKDGKLDMILRV